MIIGEIERLVYRAQFKISYLNTGFPPSYIIFRISFQSKLIIVPILVCRNSNDKLNAINRNIRNNRPRSTYKVKTGCFKSNYTMIYNFCLIKMKNTGKMRVLAKATLLPLVNIATKNMQPLVLV